MPLARRWQAGTLPYNWYLRSDADEPVPPDPEPPIPGFRQEVSLYFRNSADGRDLWPPSARYAARAGRRGGAVARTHGPRRGGDTCNGAWGRVIGHRGHRDGDPVGSMAAVDRS